MTCDINNCENSECDGEECPPLSQVTEISRSIDRAVSILVDLDKSLPEDVDLEAVSVHVNAQWLAGVCSALVEYASEYDGVDVEEMFAFKLLETSNHKIPVSTTIH